MALAKSMQQPSMSAELGPRRLDDYPAAAASEQISTPRDRQYALLDEGPERVDDHCRVLVCLSRGRRGLRGLRWPRKIGQVAKVYSTA